jgi:thiamine-phosphate pyrophosphorylase
VRPGFDVLLISDGAPELLTRVTRALQGAAPGRVALLVRERALAAGALLALLQALRALTRQHQVALLVSERLDLALLADADGVHLPEASVEVAQARKLLGTQRLIGASRHDGRGVEAAARQGADYATLSPVYETPGKGPALGLAGFSEVVRRTALPLFALGGVRAERMPELLRTGARGVAVMRAVLSAPDPAGSLHAFLAAFDAAHPGAAPVPPSLARGRSRALRPSRK